MKRTKYINQFRDPRQPDLLCPDAEQIKQYHLRKLKALRDEAKVRSDEWIRKQRVTMLGEMKWSTDSKP